MTKAYQYDASGYFAGEIEDYGGPLPNNATYTAPTEKDGFIPRWNGQNWDQVENHKDETGYVDGEAYTIKDYGPYPAGWSKAPPPPSLEKARADALEKLRLRKWQAKDAGITVNGIAIDTDDKGQATINGAVTNVLINPEFTTTWKTSAVDATGASVWMTLDKTVILALSHALTAYTEACFAVEAGKQAELAGLADPEEIESWLETELERSWPSRKITLE